MKEKIVVLNSGGFDSVTLLHHIKSLYGNAEIHSLHFFYGERNLEQQWECVCRVCEKLGVVNYAISLPEFSWTKSKFYNEGYEFDSQYLEYRNLIFLSYAISYAQSIGAQKIYLAVLKDGVYNDTNKTFIDGLNSAVEQSGISIETPFANSNKETLLYLALLYEIRNEDYFSCDNPKESGESCGECLDCKSLENIRKTLQIDTPKKAFIRSGYDFTDPTFKKLLEENVEPITEVRALINNDCQLKCEHCFYGFEKMKNEPLPKEEYYEVLKRLVVEHGVKNIHFSGKEPLFDDTILWYAQKIQEDKLPCTYNLVTNGICVPKYLSRLKELGMQKLFLSVDDVFDTNGVRSVHGVTSRALEECNRLDYPVEVFLDLHANNYNKVFDIVTYLNTTYKVSQFYIRTIRSIGNGENQTILDCAQLNETWEQIKSLPEDIQVTFSVSLEYIDELQGSVLDEDIMFCERLFTDRYSDNITLLAEEFCGRYQNTITLTPDGYVLGCASEVSCPNYDEISVGNVKTEDLNTLLERGRKESFSTNDIYTHKKLRCRCYYFNNNC